MRTGYWTPRRVFSVQQEDSLAEYLKRAADLFYSLSTKETGRHHQFFQSKLGHLLLWKFLQCTLGVLILVQFLQCKLSSHLRLLDLTPEQDHGR
ncbi:hypothetical protein DPX16_18652 [Anabarilius grahami]|uniref:Uncharacterized protein n=1 Tax=Anabarilius grahami TaxID=495550 RepID=A0A3N0YPC0_ANAGA|nr:hypothetical protein DPX16_18652 [Anabarilius grahami]